MINNVDDVLYRVDLTKLSLSINNAMPSDRLTDGRVMRWYQSLCPSASRFLADCTNGHGILHCCVRLSSSSVTLV